MNTIEKNIQEKFNWMAAELVAGYFGETLIGNVRCFQNTNYYPDKPDRRLYCYKDGYAIQRSLHEDYIVWTINEVGQGVEALQFVTTRENC